MSTTQAFLDNLQEILEIDDPVLPATDLRDIDTYDSLAVLQIIAYVDEQLGVTLKAEDFVPITTAQSLLDAIGAEHFEAVA